AEAEDEEDGRDEAVYPRVRAELYNSGGAEHQRGDRAESCDQCDDAEAECGRLREPAVLTGEVRHRDRNHREDARCENRCESRAEREREEGKDSRVGGSWY